MAKKTAAKDTGLKNDAPEGASDTVERDWSKTLYLPKTEFPMRAGLPKQEPKLLARWNEIGLYSKLRAASEKHAKFVLHDGPPYANGNIHMGHSLNKILKDLVVKSQQMLGFNSNYVPGWDCHGLPIEWKIEEQYRAKGKNKDDIAINEFRAECRQFAQKWVDVQREEFKRLGIVGDWDNPYLTMTYPAEATIANEIMKFAKSGQLYRGSKPVMWSVVEQTALAEAEVEYHDHQSDTIWVKFPVAKTAKPDLKNASVVIWTTTPWTIPGNRAISYSSRIDYGVYEVTDAPEGNWAQVGDKLILAATLVDEVMKSAKVDAYEKRADLEAGDLSGLVCDHPLRGLGGGYDFPIPLLAGDHVTDDAGTGFVHTAPGHGTDDYIIWNANQKALRDRGIDTTIPFTVDGNSVFTDEAPGFTGKRVFKANGSKGDANDAVIKALAEAGNIIARGRIKHQYPCSWRSKKPVIFRNTPQWFISMDKRLDALGGKTLRDIALSEIKKTQWVPESGQNRITGMIEGRPDWVVSRQRAWGVPICVFRNTTTDQVIPGPDFANSDELAARITQAFAEKGADVWFEEGAKESFLDSLVENVSDWEQVTDVLDVWFDSGCTHAFTLEDAQNFPGLSGINRTHDGGKDRVMYLEGSDQHRGWFGSSLLESCGTRGRAPYDIVLTHGFILDEKGKEKMSKSSGNALSPQEIMKTSGADILRLWVASADTTNDIRFGPSIIKAASDSYRKLRNTMRWMLGALAHYSQDDAVDFTNMPELERLMLHRLHELDEEISSAYKTYDFRKVVALLSHFMNTELSAFYFDIRKDTLYCEAPSSQNRKAALTVIDEIFKRTSLWLAPFLSFTAEEAWLERYPDAISVHLETFQPTPKKWRDDALAEKWEQIKRVRSVVTGALEVERAAKRIGSSLEAAPQVYIKDKKLRDAFKGVDLAEVSITSEATLIAKAPPSESFKLDEVPGVGVISKKAEGKKCARSWRITKDVGSDPDYPELSARDASAMREIDKLAGS